MAGPAAWTKASAGRSRLPFVLVSLLLHLIVLVAGMGFRGPAIDAAATSLEVVLLHEDLKTQPLVPAVVAESNASGGVEQKDRPDASPGQARSARGIEARSKRRAAGSGGPGAAAAVPAGPAQLAAAAMESPEIDGSAGAVAHGDASPAAAARPRRLTYGVDAVGASYARYVRDWTARIERLGTDHYPPEARGRLYDSLIITVEIDRHGEVVDIVINRPSKHEALNRAVRRLVLAGAPYAPFTPEMAREGDVLRIVRTWTFTNGMLEAEGASRT